MRGTRRVWQWVLLILVVVALTQATFDYTRSVLARPTAQSTEYLWGTAQSCTYTITNPGNSVDLAFNDAVADCSGEFGPDLADWTFTAIQDTTLTPSTVAAHFRFYATGLVDDLFAVQVSPDGSAWTTLETFDETNAPPSVLTTKSYDVSTTLDTQTKVNAAQLRFMGTGKNKGGDTITIYVDEVQLEVVETAPAATLKQAHYRIGDDTALASMTWKAATDTGATGIARETNFRVRFQVYNDGGANKSWQPQLEWSATSGSGYAIVPTASGGDAFYVTDTTQFTNADAIATGDFALGAGTGTARAGNAYDTQNPAGSAITLESGNYTEIEFNIKANSNAAYSTSYYFRLTDAGTIFDAYDVTEAVITIESEPGAGTLKQAHYRIGNDEPLTAMTWRGGVDQRATNTRRFRNYRVRFQVYNDGAGGVNWQPQLEWCVDTDENDVCDAAFAQVPTTSGSAPFFIADTDQFTNGATILTADFGLGTGTGTAQDGVAYDTENPPASAISLTNGYYTEIELNIQANSNAAYSTLYNFRLTNAGTLLDAYDVTQAVLRVQPAPSASDPHNTFGATTDKCASCHRVHTGQALRLRKATTEEGVCLTCHDGTGASTDISSQVAKTYNHPLADTIAVHQPGETLPSSFSGASRHAECEDCHKPHSRWPGLHEDGNNAASLVIEGASGVRVTNTAAWTAPTYTFVTGIAYEYELCFKCHSSWAYGASPPDTPSGFWDSSGNNITASQTDPSVEFNTLNRSHHAVEGPGKNQPPVDANPNWPANGLGLSNNFVSPWTTSSTVQCGDCHARDTGTEPEGPHGSDNRWLLRGNETGVGSASVFCYNCHRRDVYGDTGYVGTDVPNRLWSRFNHADEYGDANTAHVDNARNRWGIWCMTCHAGDMLGAAHGTDRSDVGTGTMQLGKRFMNGAAIAGIDPATTTVDGTLYTKDAVDEVTLCKQHPGGKSWIANYDYAP